MTDYANQGARSILLVLLVFGCRTPVNTSGTSILELQDRRFVALVEADTTALGEILSDAVGYTHASGRFENKAEHIGRIGRAEIVYRSIQPFERSVVANESGAVVTGVVEMVVSVGGADRNLRLRFTDVYLREPSGWHQVAWQSTNAMPEPGSGGTGSDDGAD